MLQNNNFRIILLLFLLCTSKPFAQIESDVNVTIVNSNLTKQLLYEQNNSFNPIYDWEIFFLNNKIRYNVIDDEGLDDFEFSDSDVLILPSVEVLSSDAEENLAEYLKLGGGVLILGRLGGYDEMGRRTSRDYLSEISGIKATLIQDQTYPSYKLLIHKSTILNNSSSSENLLILNQFPIYRDEALMQSNRVLAGFVFKDELGSPAKILPGISLSEKNRRKIVWIGFQISQITSLGKTENFLNEVIFNSINWLAKKPSVWVNLLPGNNKSTVLFTFNVENINAFNNDILPVLEYLKGKSNFFLRPDEIINSSDKLQALSAVGEIIIYYDKMEMLNKSKQDIGDLITKSSQTIKVSTNQKSIGIFINSTNELEEFNILLNNNIVDFIIDLNHRIHLNVVESKTCETFRNFEYGAIDFLPGVQKELNQIFDYKFYSQLEYVDIININLPSKNYFNTNISASEIIKECYSRITSKNNWITSYSELIKQVNNTNNLHAEIEKSKDENLLTLKISNSGNQLIEKVGLFLSIPFPHRNLEQTDYYNPPRYDYMTDLYSFSLPSIKPFQTLFIDLRYD